MKPCSSFFNSGSYDHLAINLSYILHVWNICLYTYIYIYIYVYQNIEQIVDKYSLHEAFGHDFLW